MINMPFQIAKLETSDSLQCLAALRQYYKNCFLLESATRGDLRLSRYSFLGFDPEILRCQWYPDDVEAVMEEDTDGEYVKHKDADTLISFVKWAANEGSFAGRELVVKRANQIIKKYEL